MGPVVDIRAQDEIKLLRARLKAVVDALEIIADTFPDETSYAPRLSQAKAMVVAERKLMKHWK